MGKREYLQNQLEQKIKGFRDDSAQHKALYRNLRYLVFVLTAISTLLAGLALKFPELGSSINVAIVFVSATVGVVTSIEGLRKPAELWIHERTTYYALMDLKREVEFELDTNSSPEMLGRYFFRMQEILGASGEKWTRSIAGAQQPLNAHLGAARDNAAGKP
ncbi:DUF4231 domain-containing protein [Dechloromonas denitrificans]|uniref:DUF4231 domain-containing protein n=1 Tax=Dechloromonas denitrificans TaxID=281362 RepID=UPI001CF87692|nr:DUF4231 domain-containing protein [Dechloromonas denitrificans]UCV04935.1 DUF4231 domain-containing protein [Dechloromonas denitrificans]